MYLLYIKNMIKYLKINSEGQIFMQKRKFFNKFFAVLLAVVMLLVPSVSVYAASEGTVEKNCPLIDVVGFMSDTIYADKDDPSSEVLWPWSSDAILSMVKSCIPALSRFLFDRDYQALADAVVPAAQALFGPVCLDENGNVTDGSGVYFVYPAADSIKKDSTVDFKYDWRIDPLVAAAQLNDFINYVCEASGSDKVSITCHSLGGIVTLSYLTIYGNDKIQGVNFNTVAVNGETYTGELMCGKMVLSADAVTSFLRYVFDTNEYEDLLNAIFETLNAAGLTEIITNFGNEILENLGPMAIPAIVVPMFGGWPTIWAMVPDKNIDEAMNYVFGTVYKDSEVDRSDLIRKIENYNSIVRANKAQTLSELERDCRVCVFSRYGYCSLPITPTWNSVTDGVIDAKYSSFGATCANYGEKLSDSYLETADAKYISPDKTIDASTGLFADRTWFFKDFKHSQNNEMLKNMVIDLLYAENEATVDTYEQYPQFMIYDFASDSLVPDTGTQEEASGFWGFFKKIIDFIKKIFSKIFSVYTA